MWPIPKVGNFEPSEYDQLAQTIIFLIALFFWISKLWNFHIIQIFHKKSPNEDVLVEREHAFVIQKV
jgi:hypothetical protein